MPHEDLLLNQTNTEANVLEENGAQERNKHSVTTLIFLPVMKSKRAM